MYDPPEPKISPWLKCGLDCDDVFHYDEGYAMAHLLVSLPFCLVNTYSRLDLCPYKPSGHERDTTYADEAHYQWNQGFDDYE